MTQFPVKAGSLQYITISFHQFPILQIIDYHMQAEDSYDNDLTKSIKPRNFKCPCGKSYLSYAALFTHIKQKHEGKAPGKITKPPSLHEKRGRPPVKPKQDPKEPEKGAQTDIPPNSSEPLFPPQTQQEKMQRELLAQKHIEDLAAILEEMPVQDLNKEHLNEIQVFSQMNVYLNTRANTLNFSHGNVCLADGFVQFAQRVCEKIYWNKFEPFYLLFMLFLQYIIDEQNTKSVLIESNMDLLCQYINEFVQEHAREMAEYYQLEGLWIMQKQNSISIFYQFFQWSTHKRYITYKINLSRDAQPHAEIQPESNSQKL